MENWNPNEWQGKTKKQVESSYKAVGYSFILIIFIGILLTIVK